MTFEDITTLVFHNYDLPKEATLTDICAYESLKCINFQYKNKAISRDKATSEKQRLIRAYEEQKKYDAQRKERLDHQLKCIRESEMIRCRLNKASEAGEMSKALWLDAIKCIGLMCGDMTAWKCCEGYLEGVDYEEQEKLPV